MAAQWGVLRCVVTLARNGCLPPAGWSVWTETVLTRRPNSKADSPTLGQLLKEKAEKGVLVLMLVWDDKSNK